MDSASGNDALLVAPTTESILPAETSRATKPLAWTSRVLRNIIAAPDGNRDFLIQASPPTGACLAGTVDSHNTKHTATNARLLLSESGNSRSKVSPNGAERSFGPDAKLGLLDVADGKERRVTPGLRTERKRRRKGELDWVLSGKSWIINYGVLGLADLRGICFLELRRAQSPSPYSHGSILSSVVATRGSPTCERYPAAGGPIPSSTFLWASLNDGASRDGPASETDIYIPAA